MMSKILIVYATTDGHTRKIAETLAGTFSSENCWVDLLDSKDTGKETWSESPELYDAILVAASIHAGGYQKSVQAWVRRHCKVLREKPNAFISVCLAVLQTGPKVREDVKNILDGFIEKTLWHPMSTKLVAGAVLYTKYNWIKKWIMKRIVEKAGGGTDTTRDYVYTDWSDLEKFAHLFVYKYKLGKTNSISTTTDLK